MENPGKVSNPGISRAFQKENTDATLEATLPTVPATKVGDFYKVTVAGDFENSTSLTDPTAYFNIRTIMDGLSW